MLLMSETFAVIAYCNEPHPRMARCLRSYRDIGGVDPLVAGLGDEPFSYGKKLATIGRLIDSLGVELVLVIDAWDTCCLRPIEELHSEFGSDTETGGMIIGAETNCWPVPELAAQYPDVTNPPTRYRYVNGGCWFGYASEFIEYSAERNWAAGEVKDDQEDWTRFYIGQKGEASDGYGLSLDTGAKYFHNLHGAEDDWEIIDNLYTVKSTGTKPFIAHGNGKSDINTVLNVMGVEP